MSASCRRWEAAEDGSKCWDLARMASATWRRCVIPAGLLAGALALRLPYLLEVPGFTDEAVDIRVALDILDGQWPLVDAEPYIGALFNYLLAGGFLVLGQHDFVPRLVVTVLGALTVVLTYLLGRALGGTITGVLAAALMATSGAHIVNGHIAWSNCTTPFFTTAAMLATVGAGRRLCGPLLVAAGVFFGLAVQTHASALFLAPALVAQLLFPSSLRTSAASAAGASAPLRELGWWMRRPWPYLALLGALLAVGNVIVFNLLHPGAWELATRQKEYAYVESPDLGTYLANLDALLAALVRMAASSFEGGPYLASQSAMLGNLPYVALLVVGTVYAARRGHLLPLVGIGVTAIVLPYMNRHYDFPTGVRYLGYLLPLLSLLMALPLGGALESPTRRSRQRVIVPAAVGLLLAAVPVLNLVAFYESYLRVGGTSPTVLAIKDEVRTRYLDGSVSEVLLDPQLEWIYTAPGGRVSRAFGLLFMIDGVPHRTVWMVPEHVSIETRGADRPVILIISAASRLRLGDGFDLVPLEVADRPFLQRGGYWAYALIPSVDSAAGAEPSPH
jgi:glycosyltransferase AglD